jgi:hypothetical protein
VAPGHVEQPPAAVADVSQVDPHASARGRREIWLSSPTKIVESDPEALLAQPRAAGGHLGP